MRSEALDESRASLRSRKLAAEYLGLAGEHAVASEPCSRGIYAQLTLGKHKRAHLLAETETGMVRIQVKAKREREWPGCRGILVNREYESQTSPGQLLVGDENIQFR